MRLDRHYITNFEDDPFGGGSVVRGLRAKQITGVCHANSPQQGKTCGGLFA